MGTWDSKEGDVKSRRRCTIGGAHTRTASSLVGGKLTKLLGPVLSRTPEMYVKVDLSSSQPKQNLVSAILRYIKEVHN